MENHRRCHLSSTLVSLCLVLSAAAPLASAQAPSANGRRPRIVAPPVSTEAYLPANMGRLQLSQYLNNFAYQDTEARRVKIAAITTRAEAEARQAEVRRQILELLGGLPSKTPLNAKVTGTVQGDGFHIEKVIYDSQPNFPVTALLYLPDGKPQAGGKLPGIVVAPGHGATGKTSDYVFSSTFARNGFAVLDYDPIGQGERLQYMDPKTGADLATRPTGEHGEAGLQPTLLGDAVARYFLWDGMRAVDYLQSLPEVDPNRIGAFGCSGGGVMTALLGAMDSRIKATGSACYLTSFDTLLPAIGPQDAEQSIPDFIVTGHDFPDWVELAAPRPWAIIATYADMFPFAGAQKTEDEAHRFYELFGAGENLEFLTGPGGHGNLGPIMSRIMSFFLKHLQPNSDFMHPVLPPPGAGGSPFAPPSGLPKDAFQVTSTGQVATAIPGCETVYSLNLKRAAQIAPKDPLPSATPLAKLQGVVREVTKAEARPATPGSKGTVAYRPADETDLAAPAGADSDLYFRHITLHPEMGIDLEGEFAGHRSSTPRPAILLLTNAASLPPSDPAHDALTSQLQRLAEAGNVVLALTPRPSPPGTEEIKSPILGPFYITELRAELVGKTIMGMRIDDTIQAVNYLSSLPGVDREHITAYASGHYGLVLLHAAILDPGLSHITIDHSLSSYRSLLEAPMPLGAPEDILPGVILHYDLPDLVHALGARLTLSNPLNGTDDLSAAPPLQVP